MLYLLHLYGPKKDTKPLVSHTLGPYFYILSQIDVICMGQYTSVLSGTLTAQMLSFC